MMPLWLNSSYLSSIAPAIANHLWQSTAFALAAWIATLLLRRNAARVRFGLWLAASLKFLLPFSLLIALGGLLPRPQRTVVAAPVAAAVDTVVLPFTDTAADIAPIAPRPTLAAHLTQALPAALGLLWLAGLATVLAIWLLRWRRLTRTLRHAELATTGRELDLLRRTHRQLFLSTTEMPSFWRSQNLRICLWNRRPTPIPLLLSPDLLEPGLFGILRPILLWPARLTPRLDDAQIEAILAHELIHARRRDNLTAALHMFVEALFWFHPLVWWLERRLIEERERACDEAVVALGSAPGLYADSLLKACRFCVESPLPCVSGITGADLNRRVRSIMTLRLARLTLPRKLLLAAAALIAIAAPILLGQVNAAQRMMLATVDAAPAPFRTAAHAMIALEQTPASGLIENQTEVAQDATASDAAIAVAATGPAFEVASIRPSPIPASDHGSIGVSVTPSGRVNIQRMTVQALAHYAYLPHVGTGLLQSGPDWTNTQEYDINATVGDAEAATWATLSDAQRTDRVRLMVRTLLADRFKVKLHTETQVKPVFALVQAKGGAKLKPVDAPPLNADQEAVEAWRKSDNWTAENVPPGTFLMTGSTWVGKAVPISQLLSEIAVNAQVDRLVVDETGLKGSYDFTFKPSYDKDAPILLDQIEDQLGLKLEPRKLPVKIYVIDSAEKPSLDGAELPNPSSATPVSSAQPAQRDYRFEVASIRPGPPDGRLTHSPGPRYTPGRFRSESETISSLAFQAFGKKQGFELESPQWMKTTYFAIDATIPDGATKADLPIMIQHLLEDRFALKFHHETRQAAGYELVVAKPDPRLAKSATADYDGAKLSGMSGVDTKTGAPQFDKNAGSVDMCFSHDGSAACALHGRNRTMQTLAADLAGKLQAPVTDATGLDGGYDYTLIYTPEQRYVMGPGGYTPVATSPDEPMDYPLLHDALPEQLGLKLQPVKNVTVDVVVIDSANKVPTEN